MRTCTKCLKAQPNSSFWKSNRNRAKLLPLCKACLYPEGTTRAKRRAEGETVEEKFWSLVDQTDGCWEWAGGRNGRGYGLFRSSLSTQLAHRYMAHLDGHDIEGLQVCHHCDNPSCVNPAHLFVGTAADNVVDMLNKGRFSHKQRKLTVEEAASIVDLYAAGGCTQTELALEYGVSQPLVSKLVNGKVYTRVGLTVSQEETAAA